MGAESRPTRVTAPKSKKSAARPAKASRSRPKSPPRATPKAAVKSTSKSPTKSVAKPAPKVAAKPAAKPAPKKGAAASKAPVSKPEPAAPAPLKGDARAHVLSLAFLRDGDEFLARLETDAGQITELKNRSLDQLLTLVAGELEDLLE